MNHYVSFRWQWVLSQAKESPSQTFRHKKVGLSRSILIAFAKKKEIWIWMKWHWLREYHLRGDPTSVNIPLSTLRWSREQNIINKELKKHFKTFYSVLSLSLTHSRSFLGKSEINITRKIWRCCYWWKGRYGYGCPVLNFTNILRRTFLPNPNYKYKKALKTKKLLRKRWWNWNLTLKSNLYI